MNDGTHHEEPALPARRNDHILPALRLDENPAAVYLASLAPGSRRTMQHALVTIADILGMDDYLAVPWGQLRFQHTSAVRSQLMEDYSAATANKILAALRQTLKRAWRLGQMDAESYRHAVDIPSVVGDGLDAAAGRALAHQEIEKLMDVCLADTSPAGVRDVAILALAYTVGLRRAEFTALNIPDFDTVTNTLTVRGKRNKTRLLPLVGGTQQALLDWLVIRNAAVGPLFVRLWKGGKLSDRRLTTQAIYHIMEIRAKEAGVAEFSPHDFRRTFAGDLLDSGADIATVQKLMGHANTNTTARYDRRGERAKREAVQKLHLPYHRGVRQSDREEDESDVGK